MKKHSFFASILALTLVVWCFSLSTASAVVNSDPCEVGDHEFFLVDSDISYYGGHRHFMVSSCPYASYSHQHYYVTGTRRLTYICANCGFTKTVEIPYDDLELGDICTLHDFGR